jgi:catecholate siderophore receptor
MRHLQLLLSVAALAAPAAALADSAAEDSQDTILVTGRAEGYVATNSVTATKTDTPLIDVPQSISVVTREQLDDQALHGIGDVLRYVPGITVGQGEGNRDQITLRGQNTTSDFFLDGVRDDVQYFRSLYNIERVEILKGPYALIFGRGGGGGIVNRVQKAPSAERLFAGVDASANSFGAWDIATDLNAPIGAGGAIRVNATYEQIEGHRDHVDGERYALNPYLGFDLGSGWKAGLSYEYVHDDRVTDRGVPSLGCTQPCTPAPLEGYRATFFGVPGINRTEIDAHIVKARLDGQLAPGLAWSTTLLYGDYDKYYTNVYANGPVNVSTNSVALAGYTDPTQRENFIAQSNLVWDVALGGIANKILFGLEYGAQDSANQRRNATLSAGTINLGNIVYPTVTFGGLNRETQSNVRFFSVYGQDQISFGDHVDLVVGLRFDRFDIAGTDFAPNPDRPFSRVDEKVSPRVGLVIKPRENVSLYGSFSRSFLPRSGDQFLSLTTTQENLAPEQFTNYEIGAKWDIRANLNVTAALFQLDRTNATTPDPANPAATINVGTTRTRGVELALVGRITRQWQVSGGYTYQDAKLAGNDFVRLGQVPRHQLALWNRYDVSDMVGAGLGIIHQSSQFAAIRTSAATTRLPAFTRVDAALFYNPSETLQLQLNVENLFDTDYFADAHNNNNITPGAPLNARLTARLRF